MASAHAPFLVALGNASAEHIKIEHYPGVQTLDSDTGSGAQFRAYSIEPAILPLAGFAAHNQDGQHDRLMAAKLRACA
jgi:hypothetical protein